MKKKINIIDLIVLAVIIIAIALAGFALAKKSEKQAEPTLLIQYYLEEVDNRRNQNHPEGCDINGCEEKRVGTEEQEGPDDV